ncbi:FAD-dependent monooxygenase [Streptacidiphilus sp. PB12-B1b]|uniref:FAD-dependent oxidoreductase n=1 Tax=Streptacidiphilus sp. PB12-B1b TaxID=2705012 RepID=UPI0015FB1EB3|nr:FAD-dependent monooxygenase [Streptacidiphilus sp. PB12-B1b]QMU78158.1 FAD-dependent monooxygenase [Streptacidiphilus sp. PB12-B1b]
MTTSPFHVIVIGGGTGGMALAHGLKRAGISVAVYERDRTRTSGLHGYRVGIDPDGSRSLKKLLPPELYDTFVATCAREPRYFIMLTEKLKTSIELPLRQAEDDVNGEKSVSRMTLRQVLFTGMEDVVEFDKEFTHYEQRPDGRVTAFFADGTHAEGDLLVAADGASSRVRRQYLPHAGVEDAKIISITAKVPITPKTKKLLPENVFNGIGLVLGPKGGTCILHTMEFPWGADGELKSGIGGNDADLIEHWPGMLFDNTRDYINWGFWASTDKFPADVMKMRGEDLIELVLKMTPTWSKDLRTLFGLGDPSTCFPINIRTSVPIPQWEASTVTLLGDAIHTMTPGQGVGANTALRDAALITKNLVAFRDGRSTLLDAVRDYETKMVKYGFEAVIESKKQTSGDQPVHKPYIGRLALAGMRAFLFVAARVPSMKRKMAEDIYIYRGGDRED